MGRPYSTTPRLLDAERLGDVLSDLSDCREGEEIAQHIAALDQLGAVLIAERDRLAKQLDRAKNAIAILYVGNKARRPDGSVDVDAIINSILGEG